MGMENSSVGWISQSLQQVGAGLPNTIEIGDGNIPYVYLAIGASFSGTNRQPDTFHAISHRLGKWVNSLEKSAYAAIAEEYQRLEVFDKAGNPCNRGGAEENIRVALDFMIGLPINKIKKQKEQWNY